MIALLLATAALAGPIRIDRIDIISEDPSIWINDDAARFRYTPRMGALRFLAQVKTVVELPMDGVYFGASVSSQSLVVERLVLPKLPIYSYAGVQTNLLLPRGVMGGLAVKSGPIRVGLGFSGLSSATWARPDWSVWTWLPAIGVGIGRSNDMKGSPVW
jgi:hypothetical protein